MSNLSDYIDWRGDISFAVDPFNEVDNLVFSFLVYAHFGGIVPGPDCKHTISMQKLHDLFFAKHKDTEFENATEAAYTAPLLLHKMIHAERYQDIKVTGYVSHTDEETQVQFACMTYILPDGTNFIAFRGTDHTIVGWKEDFNMSFLYKTPGQIMAAEYLNKNFKYTRRKLRIGGHSKGGNFAVFAGAFCAPSIQKKILDIYSNDGPGFREQLLSDKGYQRIVPKIHRIVPEQSVVSMMFESHAKKQVIVSAADGLLQHDMITWQVCRNRIVPSEHGISDQSLRFQKTFQNWLSELDEETRKMFVDELFGLLATEQRRGVLTIDDLIQNPTQTIRVLSKNIGAVKEEHQEMFKEVLRKLAISGKDTMKDSILDTVTKSVNNSRRKKTLTNNKKTKK